jgi:hypothetical protein
MVGKPILISAVLMATACFPALSAPDPLAITDVNAAANPQSVTVTWKTNVPATSRLDWGTAAANTPMNKEDSAFVTDHSVTMTGLTPGTVYYIQITSVTAQGERVVKAIGPPQKAAEPAPVPPPTPQAKAEKKRANWYAGEQSANGWYVEIYPIYAYLPVFGASIDLPSLPSLPGTGGSGSTGPSLNGALESQLRIEKGKWSIDAGGLWAGMSSTRATPFLYADMNIKFFQVMIGREVLPHFYLEGGFRKDTLDFKAQLGGNPQVETKPDLWDPLVGFTYRRNLGRKLLFHGEMRGGGFGVGTDYTVSGLARLDWHFLKHFGTTIGFGAEKFSISKTLLNDTVLARTLTVSPTTYGPLLGIGIYF